MSQQITTDYNWVGINNDAAGVAPNPGLSEDNYAWNFNGDRPVWVFANEFDNIKWNHPDVVGSAKIWEPIQENMGPIASHEIGHGFGLRHDGIEAWQQDVINLGYHGDIPYYGGLGTGETGWGPIMGGAELRNLTQWSKLEYDHAIQDGGNPIEDDIKDIAFGVGGYSGLGFRDDDHGNALDSTATHLSFVHDSLAICGGIIGGSIGTDNNGDGDFTNDNDIDVFHFDVGSTAVDITINVDPVAVGPNLDVGLNVYDSTGSLLWSPSTPPATVNPSNSISASYAFNGSGEYYIEVDGVGNGDPEKDGYSDYGSLGQYSVRVILGNGAPSVVGLSLGNAANEVYNLTRVSGSGEQLRSARIDNVNKVSIAFSKQLDDSSQAKLDDIRDALTINNLDGTSPTLSTFSYDPSTRTAHWTYSSAIADGRILLTLDDTFSDEIDNLALDGELRSPWSIFDDEVSRLPSGDQEAGGEFRHRFTIMSNDDNRNNIDGLKDYTNWLSTEPGMIYVSTTVDEVNNDLSFGDVSLREAVQHANDQTTPTTIELPTGIYQLTRVGSEAGNVNNYNDLDITGNVTILGYGAGLSVIDSNALTGSHGRIFDISTAGAALDVSHVTLTSGSAYMFGNGMAATVASGALLKVTNSAVVNHDTLGSAIYVNAANVTIRRSVFTNNESYYSAGPAVRVDSSGTVRIGESIFALNMGLLNSTSGSTTASVLITNSSVTKFNEGKNLVENKSGGFFDVAHSNTDFVGTPDFVVTSIADTFDNSDNEDALSLREAVGLANNDSVASEIWLPAWDFILTRDRATYGGGSLTDTDVSFGDLDISESLVIRGVEGVTAVHWKNCVKDAIFDLLGDFTGDGISSPDDGDVDGADYLAWLGQSGSEDGIYSADGDDDGDVDGDDLSIWSSYFGNTLNVIDIEV